MKETLALLTEQTVYGHTPLQWMLTAACILGAFIIGKITKVVIEKYIRKFAAKLSQHFGDALIGIVGTPVVVVVTAALIKAALVNILSLTEQIQLLVEGGFAFLVIVTVAWVISGTCRVVIQYVLTPWVERSGNELAEVLLSPLQNSLQFIVWFLAIVIGIDSAGYDVGAVLAGLGIGGLAVAMAARETLGDLLGGITLIVTRPFMVGQLIEFDGRWVKVVTMGIRMTIAEDFANNAKVVIPNAQFFTKKITNISAHPGYMVLMNLRLNIDTHPDKVEVVIERIAKLIDEHERTRFIWIKLDHFDEYAFVLRLHYDILSFKERNKVKTEINLGITRLLREHDVGFSSLPVRFDNTLPQPSVENV